MSRLCRRHARATITQLASQSSQPLFHRSFANSASAAVLTKTTTTDTEKSKLAAPSLITDLSQLSSAESVSSWLDDGLPYDPNDPIFTRADPHNLHSADRLSAMADKYKWINWSRFADHIHRSDIHFFDEEVKIVDENMDIEPNTKAIAEQDYDEEHEIALEAHKAKLFDMLPYSVGIDGGTVSRVTRFGKMRSCWAMVLAGDKCGTATFGIGKADEYEEAIARAENDCINNITFLPMIESRTILYETIGQFGVCKVSMRPLPRGTGMVAGLVPRIVFEAFGLQDINAKVHGRGQPKHQLLAVWDALTRQRGLRELNIARGARMHKMFERGTIQPRTPPRVVLQERALDISRKLKEVSRMMASGPKEEILDELVAEGKAYDNMYTEGKSVDNIDITDRNNDYDQDDIADGNPAEEMDKDRQHWGMHAIPPNYVPTLPPMKPFIPSARPSSRGSFGRK